MLYKIHWCPTIFFDQFAFTRKKKKTQRRRPYLILGQIACLVPHCLGKFLMLSLLFQFFSITSCNLLTLPMLGQFLYRTCANSLPSRPRELKVTYEYSKLICYFWASQVVLHICIFKMIYIMVLSYHCICHQTIVCIH